MYHDTLFDGVRCWASAKSSALRRDTLFSGEAGCTSVAPRGCERSLVSLHDGNFSGMIKEPLVRKANDVIVALSSMVAKMQLYVTTLAPARVCELVAEIRHGNMQPVGNCPC